MKRSLRVESLEQRQLLAVNTFLTPGDIPGDLTVSTMVDEMDGDYSVGDLSFREALSLVNDPGVSPDIAFDGTISKIDLDSSLGSLLIASTATIDGTGVTIDAKGAPMSVFTVDTTDAVAISGLTITGGNAPNGGGINVNGPGSLTLDGVTISGNAGTYGAGIFATSDANVVITGISDLSDNTATVYGGAIYASSGVMVSIDNTLISANMAIGGGGIYMTGATTEVTLTDSVLSSNISGDDGGGVYAASQSTLTLDGTDVIGNEGSDPYSAVYSYGGGVFAYNSTVNVLNGSTFSSNQAKLGGAIGIYGGGNVTIDASTIGSDDYATEKNNASNGGGIYLLGTEAAPSSVTIQNGSSVKGNRSIKDGAGVYAGNYATVTVTDSEVSGNYAHEEGSGFYFGAGSTGSISGTDIVNNQAYDDGGGLFIMGADATVTVDSSVISNNLLPINPATQTTLGGGAFVSQGGDLTITNSTIAGNEAEYGAAVTVHIGGTATIDNTTIDANHAGNGGGAISVFSNLNLDSVLTVTGSTITGNSADVVGGGAIYAQGANSYLMLSGTSITGNSTDHGDGGAIYLKDRVYAELFNVEVSGNAALDVDSNQYAWGGGIYADYQSELELKGDTNITGNSAEYGGGIALFNSTNATVRGDLVTIDGNIAGSLSNIALKLGSTLTDMLTDGDEIDENDVVDQVFTEETIDQDLFGA